MTKICNQKSLEGLISSQQISFSSRQFVKDETQECSFVKLTEDAKEDSFYTKVKKDFSQIEHILKNMKNKQENKLNNLSKTLKNKLQKEIFKIYQLKQIPLQPQNIKQNARFIHKQSYQKQYRNQTLQNYIFQLDQNKNFVKQIRLVNFISIENFSQTSKKINKYTIKHNQTHSQYQSQNDSIRTNKFKEQTETFSNTKKNQNRKSASKLRQSTNNHRQQKRTRIYQEILAQYTTKKLLAMK